MQMPVQALYTTAYHRIFHGGLDDEDRRNLGADAPYHRRRRISFLTHTRGMVSKDRTVRAALCVERSKEMRRLRWYGASKLGFLPLSEELWPIFLRWYGASALG
jgi:hypothetical protein